MTTITQPLRQCHIQVFCHVVCGISNLQPITGNSLSMEMTKESVEQVA